MSKKIIALVLAVLVAAVGFVLVACNGGEDTTTAAPSGSENASSADAASDLAYVKSKGTLVIGITDYAPMNYKEEGSDKWTGFDTEYAKSLALSRNSLFLPTGAQRSMNLTQRQSTPFGTV